MIIPATRQLLLENTNNFLVGKLPNISYYLDYVSDPESISIFWTNENSISGFLPISRNANVAFSSKWSYVSDYYKRSEDVTIPTIDLMNYLSQKRIKDYRFRNPEWFNSNLNDLINNKLITQVSEEESSIIDLSNYHLSSRRSRTIKKISSWNYSFKEVEKNRWQEVWSVIEKFGTERKLNLLSFNRLENLLNNHAKNFNLFCVLNKDNIIIACALVQYIDFCVRVPNYFGVKSQFGATDFLLKEIIELAKNRNYKYVDLGTSKDPKTGEVIEGIRNYKSEWGAESVKIPILNLAI